MIIHTTKSPVNYFTLLITSNINIHLPSILKSLDCTTHVISPVP